MSVLSEKHDQNRQQTLAEDREYHSTVNWSTVALGLALFLLFWLIGPVIFPALLIQGRAAAPIWDAKERWTSVRGSAFLSLLCYLPTILLHQQLTSLWSHAPALGEASIFPPTFANVLFRWVMALPLVYLLAWIVEVISPKTVWHPKRVLLPDEQALVASTESKDSKKMRSKATQRRATSNDSAFKATEQTSRVPTWSSQRVRVTAKSPSTPARESKPRKKRDARTLWEQLPDEHPWKQEAKREATRQAGSQQAIPPQAKPNPSSQQADYNWDEGEGSVKI